MGEQHTYIYGQKFVTNYSYLRSFSVHDIQEIQVTKQNIAVYTATSRQEIHLLPTYYMVNGRQHSLLHIPHYNGSKLLYKIWIN